jgi:addiction module RelE/StbE family toxin
MQIKWFSEAIQDLTEVRKYIAKDKPRTAQDVAKRVVEEIALLKNHPGMGRPGRVEGTREFLIPGLPYIIPYRVRNNIIELLRLLHAARIWPKELILS